MCKVHSVHMIVVIDIAFIVNSYRYLLVGQHSNFIYRVSQNRLHIHTAIKFVTAAALFSQHKMANLAALQLRLRSLPPLSPFVCFKHTSRPSCSLCTPLGFISVQIWCRVLFNCQPQVLFECANLINLFRSVVLLCALCIVCVVCGAQLRLFLVYLTLYAWSGQARPGQTRRQLKCAAVKWQDKRQDKTWAALDMHINCLKQSICCYFKRPWQSICRRWVDRPCCISDRQIGQLSRWAAWETGAERDKDRERAI